MTFSYTVKKELCRVNTRSRHCALAELAGIVQMCGVVALSGRGAGIQITTEHKDVVTRIISLLKKTYGTDCELSQNQRQLKKESYTVRISHDDIVDMLQTLGISISGGTHILPARFSDLTKRQCCKAAYVRGAFLGGGSISDPRKLYHLEFVAGSESSARMLARLLTKMEISAKYTLRRQIPVVYVKEAESIVKLLTITGAHACVLELENIRILKGIRNTVNRQVNCDNANIDKTVRSALTQIENIHIIEKYRGLKKLSPPLREAAELRLTNPEASLAELAALSRGNTSRSGMNNRLRKLARIAETIRAENG